MLQHRLVSKRILAVLGVFGYLRRSRVVIALFQLFCLRVKLRAFPIDGYLTVSGGAIFIEVSFEPHSMQFISKKFDPFSIYSFCVSFFVESLS